MGQVSGPLMIDPSNFQSKLKLTAACPQVTEKVDNEDVQCLLDTDSQVTLFSESLCNELFKEKEQAEFCPGLKLEQQTG